MDEQRILEEMERMLAADDPRLAARLAAFGQPGIGQSLRTRRTRAALSVLVLVLIAAVAAVIYLMSSFRPGNATNGHRPGQVHSSSPPASSHASQRAAGARPGLSGRGGRVCAATWCGGWALASGAGSGPAAQQ